MSTFRLAFAVCLLATGEALPASAMTVSAADAAYRRFSSDSGLGAPLRLSDMQSAVPRDSDVTAVPRDVGTGSAALYSSLSRTREGHPAAGERDQHANDQGHGGELEAEDLNMSAVPLPGSLALLLSGLAAILLVRARSARITAR